MGVKGTVLLITVVNRTVPLTSSALKSGGNIIKNFVSNGTKQLVANTTRKVAGKVVSKTFVGVAKNVGKNILSNSVEAAIISGFNGVFKKGIQAACQ